MAPRKAKAGAKPGKETESVKPSEVLTMVPKGPLMSVLNLDKRTKKQQAELGGELGSKVGDMCERYGTNRKALGVVRMLNRMEIEKVADFLDHLDYLLDVSGLEEAANKVQRLPLNEKGEEEADDGEAGGEKAPEGDGKVSRPSFGARAAADA